MSLRATIGRIGLTGLGSAMVRGLVWLALIAAAGVSANAV